MNKGIGENSANRSSGEKRDFQAHPSGSVIASFSGDVVVHLAVLDRTPTLKVSAPAPESVAVTDAGHVLYLDGDGAAVDFISATVVVAVHPKGRSALCGSCGGRSVA